MDTADSRRPRATTRSASGFEWHWAWDVLLVGPCLAAIALVLLPNNRFPGNAPAAAAALAAIVVCVLVIGRRLLRWRSRLLVVSESNWQAGLFVGAVVTLSVMAMWFSPVAVASVPMALVAAPVVYPIAFVLLPIWTAIVVSIAVTLTMLIIVLTVVGPTSLNIPLVVFTTLGALIAAPLIGTFGSKLMRQGIQLAAVVSELAASRAESARLSSEAGAAAERERLARDIHDTLAQGFTSIVALAQVVEAELETDPTAASRHVELIRTTARENLTEARVMVAGLTPTALNEASLAAAIRRQCDRLTAETGIAVNMSADSDLSALGMAADVVLLRATQEAFANVRKHSQASAVRLELSVVANGVRLSLADNGVGLGDGHTEGFGLRGMRSRVTQVGGTMTVTSTSGGGVTIEVEVPP